MNTKQLPLSALISMLVIALIVSSLGLAYWLFSAQLRASTERAQEQRVVNVAQTVASEQRIRNALRHQDASLQHDIEALRRTLGVDFIVIIDGGAIRLTHPDPTRIGHHFQGGDEARALAGEHYASHAQGTLGTSIRGFAPVKDERGDVIGAVSVGVTLSRLAPLTERHRGRLLGGLALIMVVGALGATWLAGSIKRRLMGMEPNQIAQLVEERHAMLDAMHEGTIAVDAQGDVTLINPAALRLLRAAGVVPRVGYPVTELLPNAKLDTVLATGHELRDQEIRLGRMAFLGTGKPMFLQGNLIGAIMTFRDKTEIHTLAEELTGVRRYAEALRASTHEFKNKLHVVMGLAQLGDIKALRQYLRELVDYRMGIVEPIVEGVHDPVLSGFLLGKQSEAREKGIELAVLVETIIPAAEDSVTVHTLISIMGNLLENAFDGVASMPTPQVALTLGIDAQTLSLHVQDNGPGIPAALRERVFERGYSSKGRQRGLGLYLVREYVESADGTLNLYSQLGQGTLIEVTYPYPLHDLETPL
ncbi:ATP-binding protein [Phytohalomonas tamaricis]|uniref:ATP-binding protein n=1 Tax=Phytohalomonas tamaricis TaxID=2081032 RepID=UPI000D0B47CB|nr:sensor histidine kinase [Phytohalomonas tamaricis]